MAEQNTPPGGRPGRPFIPPFRGPAPSPPAGGTPASERAARPLAPPAGGRPGFASPPGIARPVASPPVAPVAPRPATPLEPAAPPAPPLPPEAVSHAAPMRTADALAAEPSPLQETAEGLELEHAISEMLGQGGEAETDLFGLSLERASEGGDGIAATQAAEEPPSGGPELPLLFPPDEMDDRSPAEERLSKALEAVEQALADEERADASELGAGPASSVEEPMPWIERPAPDAPIAVVPESGAAAFEATPHDPGAAETPVEAERATPFAAADYVRDAMDRAKADGGPAVGAGSDARAASTTIAAPGEGIVGANVGVAEALEAVARRIRAGRIRVPAVDEAAGEAGALAAALAALLGVGR